MRQEDKAWVDFCEQFADVYDELNYNKSLQSRAMRAGHKFLEKAFDKTKNFERIIEIGAGTGEHVPFVRHNFQEYVLSDMDIKTLNVAKNKLAGLHDGKLKFEIQTGEKLDYPDNSFDRLIATHVLEHIYQPHMALKEWQRIIKNGGTISILIPADPGFAWRFGRNFGPRKNATAKGIPYDYIMARQHVNPCNNLIAFLRHYFPVSKEGWWPFRIASMDMNLFFIFHGTVQK